jgi:hypothetical protein
VADHDELRESFRTLASGPSMASGDVLEGIRPRMRRARFVRRIGVAAAPLSLIVVVAIALTAAQSRVTVDQTVATDDGGLAAVVGTPTPNPERQDQQTDVDEAPLAATDIGQPATTGRTPEPSPTETPVDEPTATPPPTPTATSNPTASPTPDSPVQTELIETEGGTIDIEYTAALIVDVRPDPAAGYQSEIEKQEPTEAKVIFRGEETIEVEIRLEDGEVLYQAMENEEEEDVDEDETDEGGDDD